jgi:hypothetical protein
VCLTECVFEISKVRRPKTTRAVEPSHRVHVVIDIRGDVPSLKQSTSLHPGVSC